MAIDALMMEGLRLMVAGMGIVFVFLVLLVFAMKGMSRVAFVLGGSPESQASTAAHAVPAGTQDDRIVAVISAAIARYRQNRH